MPVSVAFLATSAVAILSSKGRNMMQRIEIFCRGSANNTILLMIVIFMLAGAFSGTARAMGAVDATVNIPFGLGLTVIVSILFSKSSGTKRSIFK
jgi:Na+/H+ antiporter NhaC